MDIANATVSCQVDGVAASGANDGAVQVQIYENQVPAFVERELERLYESIYCTLTRFRLYREAQDLSTYVARCGNVITCIILFRIKAGAAEVVNQQITLSESDLRHFAETIFGNYRRARVISLYAIDAQIGHFRFPIQKRVALEDNVLALPATQDEYTDSVRSTLLRKRLRPAQRKLMRDYSDVQFKIISRADVRAETLMEIVKLAGARMAAKQSNTYVAETEINAILQLIHAYGFVGVILIDGIIRAGIVSYGVGGRHFMHIMAHDPAYDMYMLGHMVMYQAICHCITLGGREVCLMGGWRQNKARFLAFPKYFDSIDIYRSRFHFVLSWRRVSAGVISCFNHQAKHRWIRQAQRDGPMARAAAACLALARRARQLWRSGR